MNPFAFIARLFRRKPKHWSAAMSTIRAEDAATMAGQEMAIGHLSGLVDEGVLLVAELRKFVDSCFDNMGNGGVPERGEVELLDRTDDWLAARVITEAAQPAAQGQQEPVNIAAVAEVVEGDEGLELSWTLEGGICELVEGCVLLVADRAVTDDTGHGEVYTAAQATQPAAPVVAVEPRCQYCDGTGDVHTQTGEWRGTCTCEAGQRPNPVAALSQQEPVAREAASSWCLYVAGMVGAYLELGVDDPKIPVMASVIERRIWALRLPPAASAVPPGMVLVPVDQSSLGLSDLAMRALIHEGRLDWLHSTASNNVDGYEWGVFRIKWSDGKAVEILQTFSNFSDLDEAMAATGWRRSLAAAPQQHKEPT